MADGPAVVTSTGIARMAGVGRAAVSNWRRRHADFPAPVGGSASSPTFDLAAVEKWLARQGKLVESSLVERTWRRIEVFSSAPQITDALCLAGALLLTRPGAGEKAERAPIPTPTRLLRDLKARSQAAAEAFAPIILAAWSPQQKDLLRAVAELAGHGEPGDMFEFLHWRCVTARGVSVLDATPYAVADLMTDLAGVGQTVLDFSCGTGTMLRTQIRRAADTGATVRCFGQEPDPASARVALLRLLFAQDAAKGSAASPEEPVVCQGDALLADAFGDLTADVVLSNPPFGIHDWGHEQLAYDPRWSYGLPPRTEPELAWVQHALAHLVPGGRAVLVMPPAAAARSRTPSFS